MVTPSDIRIDILEMITHSNSSHIGSCFSIVDILWVLYFRVIKIDPEKPLWGCRDKFILSKAHASASLYATLSQRGFFPKETLKKYYIDNGTLPGHLDKTIAPGVEISGGSLGHGLSIGVGMALANKLDNNRGHIYVLIGDGECNEGSIWEAIMFAGHMKLKNVTAIIDFNKLQSFGKTNDVINQSNLYEQFKSFGWEVFEVNGHDVNEIEASLLTPQKSPKAIIAHTVKGKGVSFMENKLEWHYKSPSMEQYHQAILEIKQGNH